MIKSLRGRVVIILLLVLGSAYYLNENGLKLGLDLQGGMHLVLEVDDPEGTMTAEARSDAIDRAERVIRTRIDEFGVEEPLIQKIGDDRLIVELAGLSDEERAKELIGQTALLEFKLVRPTSEIQASLPRLDRQVVLALGADSIRSMGRAVEAPQSSVEELLFRGDTAGAEAAQEAEEAEEGLEPLEGDTIPEEGADLRPLTSLLNQGTQDGNFLIAEEDVPVARHFLSLPEVQRALPRGISLQWGWEPVALGARTYRELYILQDDPFITGAMLEGAQASRDQQYNQAIVSFELSRTGGRRFEQTTGQNIGNFIAIVLDDEVVSAPVVRSRIGRRGQIELGQASMEEASDLALVLRAGALPAPLRILEERTVGPSLGEDSIAQGQLAGIIGIILVVLVIIGYYRVAGILAVVALGVYVALVLGGLAAMNATLTLPGIAGLILSVGMAVDANVLIFERIREELDQGRAIRTAVDEGFGHALSAIVDANITTLITALILYQFGTGPVQGFAVTLSIGIIASFFTALYVTRSLFLLYLSRKRASDAISI